MTAIPSEIGALISDGVVVSTDPVVGAAVKLAYASAEPVGDPDEIEMFFDDPGDAQILLNEKWNLNKLVGQDHLMVELEESAGLGSTIPLGPVVPKFQVIEASSGLDQATRLRSFGVDHETDRFPIELLQ